MQRTALVGYKSAPLCTCVPSRMLYGEDRGTGEICGSLHVDIPATCRQAPLPPVGRFSCRERRRPARDFSTQGIDGDSSWIRLFNGTGLPRSTSAGRPTLPGPDSELLARGKCLILSSQHGPSVSRAWRFSVHAGGYFCILIRIEARMMGLSESRRPVSNAFTRGATERLSRLTRFSSAASEQRGASICRGAGRSRAPRIAASAPKGRHCFRNNK
jgi:hypothetical protein